MASAASPIQTTPVPMTTDLRAWLAGDGVLYATIRSFKGLEADAVVMIDVEPEGRNPRFTPADFYVACSRAKHLLAVLPVADGVV